MQSSRYRPWTAWVTTAVLLSTPLASLTPLASSLPAQAQSIPGIGGGEINLDQSGQGGQSGGLLDGLLQQLQGYLDQIAQIPQMAMEQIQTYLGGVMQQAQEQLQQVLGDLGIVDPDQLREELLNQASEDPLDPRVPSSIQTMGVEASVAGRTIAQTTLGEDGQARIKQELEAIVQTVSDSQDLAQASGERMQADEQAAQQAVQASEQSAQSVQQASGSANQVRQLAGQAQSRTSTQDVLKLLAQQTAGNGQIMAQLSAQLGGNANQLGQVASQLSSHSAQNANAAQLQAQAVQLAANQATSAEEANLLLSGATLNLTEINDQMRGERIARIIQQQAETARLGKTNFVNYRLLY